MKIKFDDPRSVYKRRQRYYHRNKKRILEKMRAYQRHKRATDPEFRKKAYARNKRWVQKSPKRKRERDRLYYQRHREKVKARIREYRRQNPDKIKALNDRSRKQNAGRLRILKRCYYRANPEKFRLGAVLRRARRRGATTGDRKAITAYYRHVRTAPVVICHYCRKSVRKGNRTVDHVIPLCKGGKHCVSNFVPACLRCNLRKGAR